MPKNLWIRVIFALSGLGLKTIKKNWGGGGGVVLLSFLLLEMFYKVCCTFSGPLDSEELRRATKQSLPLPQVHDWWVCDNFSSKKNAQ